MASGLLEWFAGTSKDDEAGGGGGSGFGIAPGVVKSNFNMLSEGRVQVHIAAYPEIDPWARVVGVGGGDGRGFLWIPQIDDEVLVAFNKNDHRDAYVIGGLWSTMNRPPVISPTDFLTKRVLKTGMKDSPVGHSIEFDDALQSVTIVTSTKQQVTLEPEQIEVSAMEGALTITLSASGIDIEATVGDLTLSAPVGTITLEALNISIPERCFYRHLVRWRGQRRRRPDHAELRRTYAPGSTTRGFDQPRNTARPRPGQPRCAYRGHAGLARAHRYGTPARWSRYSYRTSAA